MKRAPLFASAALVVMIWPGLTLGSASLGGVAGPVEISPVTTLDSCTYGPAVLAPIEPAYGIQHVAQWAGWSFVAVGLTLVCRRRRQRGSTTLGALLLLASITGLVTAHKLSTATGSPITHFHRREESTPERQEFLEAADAQLIPGQRTVEAPPSTTYDCHGKTFDGTGSWINDDQVEKILQQNGYDDDPAGGARLGDIVVYRLNGQVKHSGIVTGVDSAGNVTEVCSKWGDGFEYRHKPNEVPQGQSGVVNGRQIQRGTYGKPTVYRKT